MEEGNWQDPVCCEAQSAVDRMLKRPVISVGWLLARRSCIFRTVKEFLTPISVLHFTESAVPVGVGAEVELLEDIMGGSPIPVPDGAGNRVDVGFSEECLAPLPLMGRSPAW